MAEAYRTDEEQVEAIKKWWKENGTSTVVGVVIAVVGVFGWQNWQASQAKKVDMASGIYQNLVTVSTTNNGPISDEQKVTAQHLADTLKKDFPDSTYAQFAAFYKAKFAVESKDLTTAENELRWVLNSASSDEIKLQAQLRLARVLAAKEDYTQALQLLNRDAGGYIGAFEEVKGDIYRAKGEIDKAIAAYEKASDSNAQAKQPKPNPLLEMKIQQLKSELGSVAANRVKEG